MAKENMQNLSSREIKAVLSSPQHPLHQEIRALLTASFKFLDACKPAIEKLSKEWKKTDREADELITLLDTLSYKEIQKMPSVSIMTVISVIARMDDKTSEKAKKLYRDIQSEKARRPRQRGRNPANAKIKKHWEQWQKKPLLYKDKAAFIRAMETEQKFIIREGTVYKWMKEWQEEAIIT